MLVIRLDRSFFARDTLLVARELLGQRIVHLVGGHRVAGYIVEVEVYMGWHDEASHGYRGLTPRNAVMFGPSGFSYVYFCYGAHWMMNVVAKPADADYPAAILLRAIEPSEGLQLMTINRPGRPGLELANGPGKLTKALGITGAHNGLDIIHSESELFFEGVNPAPDEDISRGPRIGINVPEPSRSNPWRFWITTNRYVSSER